MKKRSWTIQNEAGRITLGAKRGTSNEAIQLLLQWENLKSRRYRQRLHLFYKILKNPKSRLHREIIRRDNIRETSLNLHNPDILVPTPLSKSGQLATMVYDLCS